ncbi:MAG: hypothetical protein HQK76_20115 [Desulfobacterales bacterium]|nr:hypothetical protein [Desulfobacterales bacterium]
MELIKKVIYYKRVITFMLVLNILFLSFSFPSVSIAKEPLLIIREEGEDFNAAVKGITGELKEDFNINEMIAAKSVTIGNIASKMKEVSPKIVILMENRLIDLYRQYQSQLKPSDPVVPSVSLMGVFMGMLIEGMKNATGISYEVPIMTSVMNIRAVFDMPFTKIGVVHREFMTPFIDENRKYCANEKIEVVSYPIPDSGNIESNLKKALKQISSDSKIDAIWIPNDSSLINAQYLRSIWQPFRKSFEKPIIVGIEVLVKPQLKFATFAVVPDHVELGAQAGRLVIDIMDNEWRTDKMGIVLPYSVQKILNYQQSKEIFKLKENFKYKVDKILE